MSIATVRHVTKDHVIITPEQGYSVIMFKGADAIEAIVASDDGQETIRLRVEKPKVGQKIWFKACENGAVEITYTPDGIDGY